MSPYPVAKHSLATALFTLFALASAAPAIAVDGPIVITQTKANAGNVTPGDAPGFPVTLSLAGSYVLASNLQPPAGKSGINIASDDVTIDLSGFRLRAAAGAATGIYGAAFERVRIRNGTIIGFNAHGIHATGDNWIVEDMLVVENGEYGIYVGGLSSSVRHSTAAKNGNTGIYCGSRCLVENNDSSGNGAAGIAVSGSGAVLGNVIIGNAGYGITGGLGTGYAHNVLTDNNGGVANLQVGPGPAEMEPNHCLESCQQQPV
jgi:hypothetical protein